MVAMVTTYGRTHSHTHTHTHIPGYSVYMKEGIDYHDDLTPS